MHLKKTKYSSLTLNIRRCDIFESIAKLVSKDSSNSRVYLPKEWDGKKVIVVLKDD